MRKMGGGESIDWEWGGKVVQRERMGGGKITQRTFEKIIEKHFTFTKYIIYNDI